MKMQRIKIFRKQARQARSSARAAVDTDVCVEMVRSKGAQMVSEWGGDDSEDDRDIVDACNKAKQSKTKQDKTFLLL